MNAEVWTKNASRVPESPADENVSMQELLDSSEMLNCGGGDNSTVKAGGNSTVGGTDDNNAIEEVNWNPSSSHLPFPEDEGVLVKVNHEPLYGSFSPYFGESDNGIGDGDINPFSTQPTLDDYNLDDVFKSWGDNMYHLLWKIVNPVTLCDIEGPHHIDDKDILKLRGSLYDTSEFHMSYLPLPMTLPEFTDDHFESHSPSQYFQQEDIVYQSSDNFNVATSSSSFNVDNFGFNVDSGFKSDSPIFNVDNSGFHVDSSAFRVEVDSSNFITSNILEDELLVKAEQEVEVETFNGPSTTESLCKVEYIKDTESPPKRVKLWETKCDICGLVLLGGQQRFEAHVKNAHELKCMCGQDFKFKLKLTNHIKKQIGSDDLHGIIPGDKIKPLFECDFCDEIFHNRSSAVKHRMAHLSSSETPEEIVESVKKVVSKRKEDIPARKRGTTREPKTPKAKIIRSSITTWNNDRGHHYNGKLAITKNQVWKNKGNGHTADVPVPNKSPKKQRQAHVGSSKGKRSMYALKPPLNDNLFFPTQYTSPECFGTADFDRGSNVGSKEVVAKINLIGFEPSPTTPTLKRIVAPKKRLQKRPCNNEAKIKKESKSSRSWSRTEMNDCQVSSTNSYFQ